MNTKYDYTVQKIMYAEEDRLTEASEAFENLGIKHNVHNNGMHWKVIHDGVDYNYFPTTGRWYTLEPKHSCSENERYLAGLLRTFGYKIKEEE